MAQNLVSYREERGVGILTLDDAEHRNVLSATMVDGIAAALDVAESSGVRCLVITGAPPVFCAGAQLSVLEDAASGDFAPVRGVYDGFLRVLHSPLPTIAAVNGAAVGAGMNLALACDVRLAAASARFDARFTRLHLHPGGGHTWLADRAVGAQQAMLLSLFGEVWDARRALDVGLVARVYDDDRLLSEAVTLAASLADLDLEFVTRLTANLRRARGTIDHAQALTQETADQQWSLEQPAFLRSVRVLQHRLASRH